MVNTPRAPRKPKPSPLMVSDMALSMAKHRTGQRSTDPFRIAKHPLTATPKGAEMAMDDSLQSSISWASQGAIFGAFSEGQAFLGYPELALLAQRPEYRRISETIALQMTRRWIKLKCANPDEDKSEAIDKIDREMQRLRVRECFREAAEQDGFFGRSHLYLDTGDTEDRDELRLPIGDGHNSLSESKVNKERPLKRLKPVEAIWVYPTGYNSNDPLRPDWYKPQTWFVQGKEIHASRLLTFIGREVPDLLKPAYSFGGLSLSQMAKPYVDNWLLVRQSVSQLITSFSQMVFKTDLKNQMNANSGEGLFKRVDFFTTMRSNAGTMVVDNENEDLSNVAAPLGTLDVLQAQAQEHMAAVSGIPLVFLLGIQPTGLNASSEGEIRAFYDWIKAYQELLFSSNLRKVLGFVQLSLFGKIDPDIEYEFEPLWALDEAGKANVRKTNAEVDAIGYEIGALSAEEIRARIANNPDTPYTGLKVEDMPDPPPGPEALLTGKAKGRVPGASGNLRVKPGEVPANAES